jgi:hypothetical protein
MVLPFRSSLLESYARRSRDECVTVGMSVTGLTSEYRTTYTG